MEKSKFPSNWVSSMCDVTGDVRVGKVAITKKQYKEFKPFLHKTVYGKYTFYELCVASQEPTYCVVYTIWSTRNIDIDAVKAS